MKKNYIARRRGTSVAAAALSFALVAPLAQPVAFAQEAPAAESAQNTDAQKPAEAASNAEAYADAIYSPGDPSQIGTISGSVKEILEAAVGFGNVQDSGKGLKGVKVYAQWFEGVNTEHASPVYYVESDESGNFTLNLAPYTDAKGVTREFRADASVGLTTGDPSGRRDERREKVRMWAELPEDLIDQYRLVHQPMAGVFPTTTTTPGTQGDGVWKNNKISGVTIQYAQKTDLPQHLPQEQWVESQGSGLYGLYQGRAFWNLHVLQGALNHNTVSAYGGTDVPGAGLQVVGSYLNDEAVKAIHEHVEKTFAGKTLRGKGWTIEDEQALQKWINEQVAADPAGWIAETVKTTTGADGKFWLYWKGIYGQAWDRKGTVPAGKFHTLAESRDEGTFVNGNSGSKHVNMDWSYVQVLDKDGNALPENVGMMYPWSLGRWAGPDSYGANAELFGGDGAEINYLDDKYLRWNVALYPAPLKFDVLEKNTYDNWARVGETVETLTDGLPIGEGLEYVIEWINAAGEVVETCGPTVAGADTTIPSCPITVPGDVKHGDVFTARLYQGKDNSGTLLAQDAFAVTTSYLEYDPTDAKVDTPQTSTPKFDDPKTEAVEPKLESAEFFLNEEKLPEGVTKDQVSVDPKTGVVTFTPKAGQEGKSFDIPVKMVDTNFQVPVYDENGDPVNDEEGNQQTRPRTIFHAPATFNVAKPVADTVDPEYKPELVVPGKETKSTPTFTDKDGNKIEAPKGSKFAIPEDFKAPEGYTVDFDENTGEITVTVDGVNKDTAEKFEVPVTVTYPDKSTDKVDAPFYLDTDGDGKPDLDEGIKDKDGKVVVEGDDDDDNDGVSDEDEKNAGTDPKDSNSVPSTIKDIEDKSGTVGKPIDSFKIEVDNVPTDGSVKVEGLPDGVTYDSETGEVSGTPTTPGKSTVTVTVLDKDGKSVTGADGKPVTKTFEFDVKDKAVTPTPDTQDKDKYQPEYEGGEGNPGGTAEVPAPKFKDDKGNETTPPEGTTFDKGEGAPKDVEIDENGKITVPVPKDAKPGDKITVPVKVTYPDNSTETVDVTVDVVKPDPSVKPGDNTTVPADGGEHTVGKVENPNGDETGKLVDKDGNEIPGSKVEIDEDGNVKVTVPEGTNPQDAKVVVTDKDGNPVGEIDVKIVDPESDAAKNVPNYGDRKNVEAGKTEKSDPFEGKTDVPVKEAKGKPSAGSEDWTFKTGETNGVVEATAPGYDKVAEKIKSKLPEIQKQEKGKRWDEFVKIFTPFAKPSVDVDFTYNDGSKNSATADFDLVGKDGKSLLDPDGDFDGDGKTNREEIEGGTNPGVDEGDIADNTAPTVDPVKPGDKKITGKDDRPNSEITVTFPDGTEKKVTTDKDGNWSVDVPKGTDLNHGDKIKVTDEAGNTTEVEVKDTTAPEINPVAPGDKTISGKGDRPGEDIKITLPNGKVIETTTDKDGNWKINVPSDVELKPGDKVTVADGAGNKATAQVGIDTGKCVATSVGFGLPLIALLPIGLATQLEIPGLSDFAAQANAQIQNFNTQIQQQMGIFNPQLASQMDAINAKLGEYGTDIATVAGGLALIAAGILAGTIIYDNCSPNGGGSSVKDLELKGSSGKTYAGSSKEEKPTK